MSLDCDRCCLSGRERMGIFDVQAVSGTGEQDSKKYVIYVRHLLCRACLQWWEENGSPALLTPNSRAEDSEMQNRIFLMWKDRL
jgi:hypothetical protein